MKKLIGILLTSIVILSTVSLGAHSQEMKTIEKYMDENDFEKNPGAFEHVALRCTAVLSLVGTYLRENTTDMKDAAERFIQESQIFLIAQSNKPNFNQDYATSQIQIMLDAYTQRWKTAKALTGNFSDDPIIKSDLLLCSAMAKAVLK